MTGFVYERISQSLGAGAVVRMAIAAGELRIAKSSYPVTVNLLQGGRVLGSASGMMAGDYVRGVPFDAFEIVNGGNSQDVVIKLASGQSGSDRIVGEVSVISGEIARVRAGVAYMASIASGAVPANYSHVQLWNPVGSGRRIVINQVVGRGGAGGLWELRFDMAPLPVLYPIQQPGNKQLGGPASVGESRTLVKASKQGSPLGWVANASGLSFVLPVAEPILLDPGTGLTVCNYEVNALVEAMLQYWEEAI